MVILIVAIILVLVAIATTIGWVAGSGAARNALEALTQERNAAQARERDRALSVIDALNAQRQQEASDALAECALLHDYALEMDDQLLHASARLADLEEAIASMREYQVKQPSRLKMPPRRKAASQEHESEATA